MARPVVKREHNDFPVSFTDFASVLAGTTDEIWVTLMRVKYGHMKMMFNGWRAALVAVKKGG